MSQFGRNIFRCLKNNVRGNYCAFMKYSKDETSKQLFEEGCALCRSDNYNAYPEHDSDGSYVRNRPFSTDPFPFGVDVIWESFSTHDTGLTYSYDQRTENVADYNCNPLYTIKDINEPLVTGAVGDEHAAYVFGKDFPAISTAGWKTQDIKGIERVEACRIGVYAQYNEYEKMVIPKCIKDYSADIYDWVNYTTVNTANPAFPRKSFFISQESNANIAKHCEKWFGKTSTAEAIYSILLAMKNGEFVDLKGALYANGISYDISKKFRRETSTMSKETLYTGTMNLENLCLYYHALGRMDIDQYKLRIYRANLINFLLNYPGIQNIDPSTYSGAGVSKHGRQLYPTNRRYWSVCTLLMHETKRAQRQNKHDGKMYKPLLNYTVIPKWLLVQLKSMTTEGIDSLPEDENLHPGVASVYKILELTGSSDELRRLRIFSKLLHAGRKWNPTEIKFAWFHFNKAYNAKTPNIFWRIMESARTAHPGLVAHFLKELKIHTGHDGEFSSERNFATHIVSEMKSSDSFEVETTPLCDRWQRMAPKPGRSSLGPDDEVKSDRSSIFWNELKKIHVKKGMYKPKIYSDVLQSSSSEDYEDLIAELNESVIMGTALDKHDAGRDTGIRIVDIDGNEDTYGEGDTWQDME